MTAHSRGSALAAYKSVATHGAVAAADRHGLVLLLIDGVTERVARMRVAIQAGDLEEKANASNRALGILDELRGCLDFEAVGSPGTELEFAL